MIAAPSNKKVRIDTPITQFIEYVKDIYRRNVVGDSKNTKWQILPSEVFINLAVIGHQYTTSKDAEEYTKAMVQDGNIDKILGQKGHIEFSDIAKDSPQNRIIVVEGAPGVGKTTFAWEFCRRWERGEIAQQYQLVLLLRLRDERMSRATSLRDIFHYPEQSVLEAVEKEITKSCGANILIILEGFYELPDHCRRDSIFMQLINGEVIHKATVLITSRPWETGVILSDNRDRIYQRIEILGFTNSQIEEYISSAFNGRNDADNFSAYLRTYPQIKASMYIPLNSAIAVAVYMDSKKNEYTAPRTLTELYYGLTRILLIRYLYGHPDYRQKRWRIKEFRKDMPHKVHAILLSISELAYNGNCTNLGDSVRLIFSNLPEDFETLDLMQSVPELYVTEGEDMSHNFVHLTLQEFLAAYHINNMPDTDQVKHFSRYNEGRFSIVLKFLAGLTKLEFQQEVLPDLKSVIITKHHDSENGVMLSPAHISWFYEIQDPETIVSLIESENIMFTGSSTPSKMVLLDYYSLGYCVVHSQSQWVLKLDSNIEEEEAQMMVTGALTKDNSTATVTGISMMNGKVSARVLAILLEGLAVLKITKFSLQIGDSQKVDNIIKSFDDENDESDYSKHYPCNSFEISAASLLKLFKCPKCMDCCHSLTVTCQLNSEDWDAIALFIFLSQSIDTINLTDAKGYHGTDKQTDVKPMESISKALSENVIIPLTHFGVDWYYDVSAAAN